MNTSNRQYGMGYCRFSSSDTILCRNSSASSVCLWFVGEIFFSWPPRTLTVQRVRKGTDSTVLNAPCELNVCCVNATIPGSGHAFAGSVLLT